jgi:hypothetical protein
MLRHVVGFFVLCSLAVALVFLAKHVPANPPSRESPTAPGDKAAAPAWFSYTWSLCRW